MIRICMKLGIALILISLSSIKVSAQGIAINSNGVKADKSAILDVSAINKGILIPRVALQNINDKVTIPSPAHSLLVYNTSENIYGKGFYYNKGTDDDPLWMQLGVTPVNSAWLTGGNDDVNDDVSYMGTNIDEDVVFRRNGTLSMQIRTGGALLATGDATGVTPTEGKGSRLMWIPAKAAFRVGGITEDYADAWNDEFIGQYSFAAGQNARAQGDYSVAMGYNTLATDPYSTALGGETKAQHFFALATGLRTVAMGNSSTAMGFRSMASGSASVAMGDSTEAKGDVSIAMGYKTFAEGDHSTATGYQTHAIGNRSTAMGENTKAVGEGSFASGKGSDALGEYSTVFGEATAIGNYSIAGGTAIATAEYATAFGFGATANGLHSFAAGSGANAMGDRSAAFNNGTTDKDANYAFATGTSTAKNTSSVAMGSGNEALEKYTVALGQSTYAGGVASLSMGSESGTIGHYSAVIGKGLYTSAYANFVVGSYNKFGFEDLAKEFKANQPLFQVGNGTGGGARSNAVTVLANAKTGINTTDNPKALLHLKATVGDGWDRHIRLEEENSGNYGAILYDEEGMKFRNFKEGNTFYFRNNNNGTIAKIESNGNMEISGMLTENSDIRLKTNIEALSNVLSRIDKIQPVKYDFIDQINHPSMRQIGFSAQEIQKVFPELVSQNKDGYLSVAYTNMTAVLLQAIKEQHEIIETQQKNILALQQNIYEQKEFNIKMLQQSLEHQKQINNLQNKLKIK